MNARVKLFLSSTEIEGVFGGGKWLLLDAIRRTGSIIAAAEELGRSYRKAWGDIHRAEDGLGRKLIQPSRGGPVGGKTSLTPFALELLGAWDEFRNEVLRATEQSFDKRLRMLLTEPSQPVEAGEKSEK
jgi:molybdate transport system regulatory protein